MRLSTHFAWDEWKFDVESEKVWVKNAGSILQDSLRFLLKIEIVDSFCKKTFARGCKQSFLTVFIRKYKLICISLTHLPVEIFRGKISYNLNSFRRTEPFLPHAITGYQR